MNSIQDIAWEVKHDRFGYREGITCPGGYWVPREFFELLWFFVMMVLPALPKRAKFSAEELCGPELWGKLVKTFMEPNSFGRCLKYFVVHEMLPLEIANPGTKGKFLYRVL